jgi:hypothetical protein
MQFDLQEHLRSQSFLNRLSSASFSTEKSLPIRSQPVYTKRTTPRKYKSDFGNESKFEERIRRIVMVICSHRSRLKYDQVFKYTTDMIKAYSIKPDRGRESTLINIIFAVVYGCRKNGIYIDPLLVSEEMEFNYKKLIKMIFSILPCTSSTSGYDIELTKSLITIDLKQICCEYVDVIMKGSDNVVEEIYQRSQYIYDLIEKTNVLSTEKQFCVTPSKIVAYAIMEHDKSTTIHEKLKFPKLFFEKIKRVVNRAEKLNKDLQ